ncbi:MAG TPA: hypothetical protein VFN94_01595 [Nitrospiria bacterium]|nr:hypothetical protein [Nitrospiria bacterium]
MAAKTRVLVVGSGALFGAAVEGLLGAQRGDQVEVESVRTVEAAIEVAPRFQPDVIVFCLERDDPRDHNAWQRLRLMEVCPARVIRCTLESNHLTIYDTTRIVDATAEDLLSAVCDTAGSPAATSRKGEEA